MVKTLKELNDIFMFGVPLNFTVHLASNTAKGLGVSVGDVVYVDVVSGEAQRDFDVSFCKMIAYREVDNYVELIREEVYNKVKGE